MSDFATIFNKKIASGDWQISGGDLASDHGLVTGTLISLFTDARAKTTDIIPDGSTDRRGYWAELLMGLPVGAYGSRLWLLQNEIVTPEVFRRAKSYAEEALKWQTESKIVDQVIVDAFEVQPRIAARGGVLGLSVQLVRPAVPALAFKFNKLWDETIAV